MVKLPPTHEGAAGVFLLFGRRVCAGIRPGFGWPDIRVACEASRGVYGPSSVVPKSVDAQLQRHGRAWMGLEPNANARQI
ncbi:hypothetical protein DHEL01_v202312 [Diaporthe helianthi]|uniref:Uncharacterized protein n=1 Tax=Diaporthe helianthi TaxID=158607 RepID=A0A2P5I9W8_DIAHE|nr:hypothetical protein DHEL01_v202312 [Diaporthe helianthi]